MSSRRGDRAIRAELAPYRRPRVRIWNVRGWVPVRQADGRIARTRIERSAKTTRKSEAKKECERLASYYEGRALAIRKPLTFARAVVNYLGAGGEARFLTDKLLQRIGVMQCADIDDTVMTDLAAELFPNGKPSYVNRSLYTPVIAVLNMAASGGHCPAPAKRIHRPRGHGKRERVKPPPESWFLQVLPHCGVKLQALLITLTLHGLRIGEAIERRPEDLDPVRGVLNIPTTKIGEPVTLELAEPALAAILMIPEWDKQQWLFGTRHRQNHYRELRKACARAGLPYFNPHATGRHAFASRLLAMGYSLKFVMDAGRWRSSRLVAETYGHLEQSDVAAEVRKVGREWGRGIEHGPGAKIIPIKKQPRRRAP